MNPDHDGQYRSVVLAHTRLSAPPLVPEIPLHLASHSHDIWQSIEEGTADDHSKRPYWAFAWPGGQAMARYLIDNPALVSGRRILDLGCGSGIGAVAAMRAGAGKALANDIDPLALVAARLNAEANGVVVETSADDILGEVPAGIDVILLADIVYEPDLNIRVAGFIEMAIRRKLPILFADRGTTRLPVRPLEKLAEYKADVCPTMVDMQFERGIVWRLA